MGSAMESADGFRTDAAGPFADHSPRRPPPAPDLTPLLADILASLRELIVLQREQLDLARRAEDRYQKQVHSQREEFGRWLDENHLTHGGCKQAEETLRTMLGTALRGLVDHIDEHADALLDADFARADLLDRFGSAIGQLSTLYGVVKRLNVVDRAQSNEK
jgi:hypothetical protein